MNPIVNLKTWGGGYIGIEVRHALNTQFGTRGWMYVGRRHVGAGLTQSPLANPYSHLAQANAHHVATRADAIDAYRSWLWDAMREGNHHVLTALRAIQPDTALVCWCHPAPCHAEVVANGAQWLRTSAPQDAATTATWFPTRVVVCGGRDFKNYTLLEQTLDTLLVGVPPVEILRGAAHGADTLGEQYAITHGLICHRFPADWQRYGRSAGFRRNQLMVDQCDMVLAFWNGESRGTKHTIDLARAKQVALEVVHYP